MAPPPWQAVLAAPAELDVMEIMRWTVENFGTRQAVRYRGLILAAIAMLRDGPSVPGARQRPEIGEGIFTLNIGRGGKVGRHFLLYRTGEGQVIEILRILHQGMDVKRHVPDR